MDFLETFARTAFLFSAVLGYILGAAVADSAGWYGLLGVFVAICVVPVILIIVVIPVVSCLAPCCGGGGGCCATPSADGRAAPVVNDQNVRGINAQNANVKQGPDGLTWYCGRLLGRDAIPGSNGQCGPKDGKQCASCLRCQSGHFGTTRRLPECRARDMPHESPLSPACQKFIWGGSCLISLAFGIFVIYELNTGGPTPARAAEGSV